MAGTLTYACAVSWDEFNSKLSTLNGTGYTFTNKMGIEYWGDGDGIVFGCIVPNEGAGNPYFFVDKNPLDTVH